MAIIGFFICCAASLWFIALGVLAAYSEWAFSGKVSPIPFVIMVVGGFFLYFAVSNAPFTVVFG